MRGITSGKIQWCEPNKNRRKAIATMYEDGTLRFGLEMLIDGYSVYEIVDKYSMAKGEIEKLCESI